MSYIKNLVLGSGGIYGFTILGALKYLEDNNYYKKEEIQNILGASIGSIIGMLIYVGYELEEIIEIGIKLDFFKLINFNSNKFLSIVENFGYDSGDKLIRVLKIMINKKTNNPDITFQELYKLTNIDFTVIVSNATKECGEYFNKDNKPDMKVWEAVIISSSVPLFFHPYKLDDDIYFDGGVNECTTNYYKDLDYSFGIILENLSDDYSKTITSFFDYFIRLIHFPLKSIRKRAFNPENMISIDVESMNMSPVNFDITYEEKKQIFDIGYKYLEKHFKPELIGKYKKIEKIKCDKSTQTENECENN